MTTTLPSYEIQKEKIIQAYFKDEIKPSDANFCFCGTLCNNSSKWFNIPCESHYDSHGYTGQEFVRMETPLLMRMDRDFKKDYPITKDKHEIAIFEGMCLSLDVLKQIHKEHGQIIEEDIPLTKRKLETVK